MTYSSIGLAPIAKNYWIFWHSIPLVALENHVFTEITQCAHSQDTWGPWPGKCDSKMYNKRNLSTQARLVSWTTWLPGCRARGLTSDNRLMGVWERGVGVWGGWKTKPLWSQQIDIGNSLYTFIKDKASPCCKDIFVFKFKCNCGSVQIWKCTHLTVLIFHQVSQLLLLLQMASLIQMG